MKLTERANKGLHEFIADYIFSKNEIALENGCLDLACGSGAWLNRIEKMGVHNLCGLDIDIDQFKLKYLPHFQMNFDAYEGTIWGRFGLVSALEIIEHLANPGMLLRLANKNLDMGGYLVISTPNIHGIPARLRFFFERENESF